MKKTNGIYDIARELVDKHLAIALEFERPISKKKLGEILSIENPDIVKSPEHGRDIIRSICGSKGDSNRKKYRDVDEFSQKFSLIEGQIKECNIEPFVFPKVNKKTLAIADLHSRFMDRRAFEVAVNKGIKEGCDSMLINGDFLDFYGYSKFDKNFSVVKVFEEQEWAQDILKLLQETFGYVVLKKGNHDSRREQRFQQLACTFPEILDISSYDDYIRFDGTNINIVEDYNIVQYGKLSCIHGHEVQGGGGIHVAHNRLFKTMCSTISAHSHIAQTKVITNLNSEPLISVSLGCLCELHPRYNPHNQWTNGFAILEKDSNGDFEIDNKIIFGNKIFSA